MENSNFFRRRILKTILLVATIVVLSSIINSCKKTMPPCKKNCVDITISGNVSLKTSGAPLPDVTLELKWFQRPFCLPCASYKVSKTITAANGSFSFTATIDTSLFENYLLVLRCIYDTSKYIGDPSGYLTNYIDNRFYDFNSLPTSTVQFDLYSKTDLTINLHRVLTDNFEYFYVTHRVSDRIVYGDYSIYGQQFAKDTTVHSTTAADVYTKIFWSKRIGTGSFNEKSDSILCTFNGPNVFNIDY